MTAPSIAGIAFALLLFGGLFSLVERWRPAVLDKRFLRKGFATDVAYWFFNPFVTKVATQVWIGVLLVVIFALLGMEFSKDKLIGFGPVATQPKWLQALEALILLDFLGYWVHRWMHQNPLWPIHAVHHSSQELDWLSSVRVHPLNALVGRTLQFFPLLALGFSPLSLVGVAPVLLFYGVFLHANVPLHYGRFSWLIASPAFHRWHHSKEAEARGKNFAGFFPVWDVMFGTYSLPETRQPSAFGCSDPIPEGLFGQLMYPLRQFRTWAFSGMDAGGVKR